MTNKTLLFLLLGFTTAFAQATGPTFNVLESGILGDSATINTKAIQKLIDACSQQGGGIVYFPKGQYLSGTILLKDNVTLQLADDAVIIGTTDINEYQLVDAFKTGNNVSMGYCFIGAIDAQNVAIIGKGRINGNGKPLLEAAGRGKRPFLLRFVRCTDITLKGVALTNSAAWTCHFFASKNINIDGVSINCRGLGNNDGFDIDCSQNVRLSNCNISTGDDGICFKSTWSKMPCRDITINNVKISSNHGGIKWGTESMAAFENIKISNVYIYDTRNGGIKMNSVDGAKIENIEISDVVMENVRTPILIRLGARLNVFRKEEDKKQAVGSIKNVTFRNISAKASPDAQLKPPTGILITGIPDFPIQNLTFQNVDIHLAGGGKTEHTRVIVPEAESEYPEIRTFGPTIPASGLWARHIDGLKIDGLKVDLETDDMRPVFTVQDGKNISITNSKIPLSSGAEAGIRLEEVTNADIGQNTVSGKSQSFVRVEGAQCQRIRITKPQFMGQTPAVFSTEAVGKRAIIITNK
jgi:hypothetical protein